MLVERQIETQLDLANCFNAIARSNGNLLETASARLDGHCRAGFYIVKCLEILRRGPCIIDSHSSRPNIGKISVTVRVLAEVLTPGEVINGCVIKSTNGNGEFMCATEHATIYLDKHDLFGGALVGSKVSVVIKAVRYLPVESKIAATGEFYVPQPKRQAYRLEELAPATASATARAHSEEKLRVCPPIGAAPQEPPAGSDSATDEAAAKLAFAHTVFARTLHPLHTPAKPATGANIFELFGSPRALDTPMYVYKDPAEDSLSPTVKFVSASEVPDEYELVTTLPAQAVTELIVQEYTDALRMVREYYEIYGEQNVARKHAYIWMAFGTAKKTAV